MNIRQYLIEQKAPLEMSRFADFSPQLKDKYKTLDGYAFDYNALDVSAIKFYYKIYTKNTDFESNFFKWFFENDMFYYAFKGHFHSAVSDSSNRGLTGMNFAIKYNLTSKTTIRSVYFQIASNTSLVIHNDGVNTWTNNYFYMYNRLIIKCINKLFKLNMPKHREAIEVSTRGKILHATIFPRFKRNSLELYEAQKYCLDLMPNLIIDNSLPAQNIPLTIHCHDINSSFITKGYSTKNNMQKIYFGCFDYNKSIFQN
jgi:hypothetical protein